MYGIDTSCMNIRLDYATDILYKNQRSVQAGVGQNFIENLQILAGLSLNDPI